MKTSFRQFLPAILALLLVNLSLKAQENGPKTVLWEISGKDLSAPSYIFGTIHVMPAEQFTPFEIADNKLSESSTLVLEMIVDVPLAKQVEWAKQMILPSGQNLKNLLSEEQFLALHSYVVDSLGVKEKKFNRYLSFKPFTLYSALIPEVMGKKLEGYELYYTQIARKAEKPVFGLETFEYQLAIFDSIPVQKQVELFFGEQADLKSEFDAMITMYREQDIYSMAASLEEENEGYGELQDKLVSERNRNWVRQLSEWMRDNSCFVAVGAGHLAGSDGLIRLFLEEGYTVQPVMLNGE